MLPRILSNLLGNVAVDFDDPLCQLFLDLHHNTILARVDLSRCDPRIIGHELHAGIQGIHFCKNLLPGSVVQGTDACSCTSFMATKKSSHDKFINLLNNMSYVLYLE